MEHPYATPQTSVGSVQPQMAVVAETACFVGSRHILEEPGLWALFCEFLRSNFCEENLSFWLDVQDLKCKFNISSSAIALAPSARGAALAAATNVAKEKHNKSLISTAFIIYNKYLAPSSQCELNIDHGLRNELAKYLDKVVTMFSGLWQRTLFLKCVSCCGPVTHTCLLHIIHQDVEDPGNAVFG